MGQAIYNYDRPFLCHNYCLLTLSDPHPSVYKERKKYCIFTILKCPSTRTPAPWVMKFTMLVDLSLFIIDLLST